VKAKMASYKRLEGGVVFLDAIPKNASGKILKNALRELARKEMGAVKAKL
jgi:4-coumarate--CoA ligase